MIISHHICSNMYRGGVPKADYDSLAQFYQLTDGDNWANKTNWLSDRPVSEWYGVTVSKGTVTKIDLVSNNLNGSIETWILPTRLTYLRFLFNANLTGDMTDTAWPSTLTNLILQSTNITIDIAQVTWPGSLKDLNLSVNSNITGNIANAVFPSGLTSLTIQSTGVTGSINSIVWPSTLRTLYLGSSVTGAPGNILLPSGLAQLILSGSGIAGDFAELILPSTLQLLRVGATGIYGVPASYPAGLYDLKYYSTVPAMSQTTIDGICNWLWDGRNNYTANARTANIGGTNPDPSGTYQAPADCGAGPQSPLEKIYCLVNDPCNEGFIKLAVTY